MYKVRDAKRLATHVYRTQLSLKSGANVVTDDYPKGKL